MYTGWEHAVPASSEETTVAVERVRHKAQLGLSVGLLSYASRSVKEAAPGATKSTESTTDVGTFDSSSITVGYGVTDSVIVSGELGVSYQTQSAAASSGTSHQSDFTLAPAVDYLFPRTPLFVGASFSFEALSTDDRISSQMDLLYGISARIGAHAFITDSVSLDPQLRVGYLAGHGTDTGKDTSLFLGTTDLSLSGFVVRAQLGLSAWL